MRSKSLVIVIVVTIMMISAVACGNADKAEESKTTDETTKEVIIASTENITQSVTEPTTKKKEEETDSHGHKLKKEIYFEFTDNFKLSEITSKNIAEYLNSKVIYKGDIVDLSQIKYMTEEFDSMQYFGFLMSNVFPHNINSSNYLEPFEFDRSYNAELNVSYTATGIIMKIYTV